MRGEPEATMTDPTPAPTRPSNFIRNLIDEGLAAGTLGQVVTRFPPEPNGYLHIGHAKSICLNFGLARDYAGRCHLRYDDTNPLAEDTEYVNAIEADVRWLGFDWGTHLYYASDYFERLYELAVKLIRDGKAYVSELSAEQIRTTRGTLTEAGSNDPSRGRSVEENLELFARMRKGDFADGTHVLRAKIDMAAANLNLRDPVLYRIRHAHHHRTGDAWCIYPTYDYAHGQSDAIEGITHSICTLEFEDHRPLYDWLLEACGFEHRPRQIEFARLNIDYTVLSKRMLIELVRDKHVLGWDDPRMPTVAGLRRRGFTPESIREFADRIGVARADSIVEFGMLESCIRDDLGPKAPRYTAVHEPLKVTITNLAEGDVREFDVPLYEDKSKGSRKVKLTRVIHVEREDFTETPAKDWKRLAPGREVRLRQAYILKCEEVVKDAAGHVTELRCTVDLQALGDKPKDGRKIGNAIHWVSDDHAVPAEIRLYDRLFSDPEPAGHKDADFKSFLNKDSLVVLKGALVEPALEGAEPGLRVQFERKGYYVVDSVESKPGALVFNRIVSLKDTWAKIAAR
jgi:glutaminyl-tRNA synthetase